MNREPMCNILPVSTNIAIFVTARWIEDMSDNCDMYIPFCWVKRFEGTQKRHYLNIGVSRSSLSSRYSGQVKAAWEILTFKTSKIHKRPLCNRGQNSGLKETKFGIRGGLRDQKNKYQRHKSSSSSGSVLRNINFVGTVRISERELFPQTTMI